MLLEMYGPERGSGENIGCYTLCELLALKRSLCHQSGLMPSPATMSIVDMNDSDSDTNMREMESNPTLT